MPEIDPTTHEKLFPDESRKQNLEKMRGEISAHLGELYDMFDEFVDHGDEVKIELDEEFSAPEYDKFPGRYEGLLEKLGIANVGLDKLAKAIEETQADLRVVDDELERIRQERSRAITDTQKPLK